MATPSSPSAVSTLIHCFAQPLQHVRAGHAAGDSVVGATTHAIPWEILRAAGLSPVVVRPTTRAGRFCEEFLEPGVFSRRVSGVFESAMMGELSFLSALIFARTSEQEYKAYLYLREVLREGRSSGLPPLWFYDLLHSPSAHAFEYGLARTRELTKQFESLAGRAIHRDDLDAAVAESNAARAAVRRLLALRRSGPRLAGSDALALVGSFSLMDRTAYTSLAHRAADEIEQRSPIPGPRLALAGAWRDDDRLHALLESHGATVVAEDGGWGSRSAGHDIEPGADIVAAIFEKYYRDGPGMRQFPPADRAWLHHLSAADIDGVVFYLPPDDSVAGWDVPTERRRLDALGIVSFVIRHDADALDESEPLHEAIAAFVQRAAEVVR